MVLAQNLRDAVLQAALQGKLTEQLETDSSVDFMLQNIEKKNQTTININFEENFLKDIPDNWKYVRLGDLLFIARGGSPRPIQAYLTDNETGVNWIKIGDTELGGKYIYSTKEKIIKEGIKKSRYVKEGDFLLTNSMSFGRPYILKTRGCIHDGWLVLSDENDCFIQDYLYWLLSSSLVFMQFSGMASGAVVKNLNIDKVKATIIPLPPIEEQQRIVGKVNELMEKIDDYEKVEKELVALEQKFPSDMKNALLQAAMQGKLTEQLDTDSSVDEMLDAIKEEKKQLIKEKKIKKEKALPPIEEDDIPFEIPDNWKWVQLGEVVSLRIGKTPPRAELEYWGDDYPWISIADMIEDGYIDKTKEKISYKGYKAKFGEEISKKGTLIMSFKLTVGRVSILKIDALHNEAIVSIVPYNDKLNKTRNYLFKVLPFLTIFGKTKNAIKGITLNSKSLNALLIPLPPVEEQERIVKRLEQLLPLCETL